MIELPSVGDSLLQRHVGVTRVYLRGDRRIAEAYLGRAQVYMGWLRNNLALGGITNGVRHISLDNGVKIRVLFDGAMNIIEIYAPGSQPEVELEPFYGLRFYGVTILGHGDSAVTVRLYIDEWEDVVPRGPTPSGGYGWWATNEQMVEVYQRNEWRTHPWYWDKTAPHPVLPAMRVNLTADDRLTRTARYRPAESSAMHMVYDLQMNFTCHHTMHHVYPYIGKVKTLDYTHTLSMTGVAQNPFIGLSLGGGASIELTETYSGSFYQREVLGVNSHGDHIMRTVHGSVSADSGVMSNYWTHGPLIPCTVAIDLVCRGSPSKTQHIERNDILSEQYQYLPRPYYAFQVVGGTYEEAMASRGHIESDDGNYIYTGSPRWTTYTSKGNESFNPPDYTYTPRQDYTCTDGMESLFNHWKTLLGL